jgi:hypothetical protein
MTKHSTVWGSWLLAGALAFGSGGVGCARHHYYRVYDPYYNDYHVWNDGELVYYRQWAREYHDPGRDFRKLRAEEQKEYWTWRHGQGEQPR